MNRALLYFTLILVVANVASACPMCKDSIPDAEGTTARVGPGGPGSTGNTGAPPPTISNGFNISVYLMLGTLFSMIALISGVIYKGVADSNRFNAHQKLKADQLRRLQS